MVRNSMATLANLHRLFSSWLTIIIFRYLFRSIVLMLIITFSFFPFPFFPSFPFFFPFLSFLSFFFPLLSFFPLPAFYTNNILGNDFDYISYNSIILYLHFSHFFFEFFNGLGFENHCRATFVFVRIIGEFSSNISVNFKIN